MAYPFMEVSYIHTVFDDLPLRTQLHTAVLTGWHIVCYSYLGAAVSTCCKA
jgi:hypothetical protein